MWTISHTAHWRQSRRLKMAKVYDFDTCTEKVSGDKFLENHKGRFEDVMLIGFDDEGDVVFGANGLSTRDVIYLLEKIKHDVMENWD